MLLKFTLLQAALSTLLSISIGLLLAWSLAGQNTFHGRSMLVTLFSSSLVLPSLIVAFGIIAVLGNHGWLNSLLELIGIGSKGNFVYGLGGILIAHTYLNASYASMGLLKALESIPSEKYRLAASLDLGVWSRFALIEWPSLKSTLPSVAMTVFMLCFGSFAIVLLLGGSPAYNTIEVAIYEAVKIDFDIPFALRLSAIQLGISVIMVLISSSFISPVGNITHKSHKNILPMQPKGLSIIQKAIIFVLAAIYILPIAAIVVYGFRADLYSIFGRPIFWRSFWTSIFVATVSAALSVFLASLLSQSKRFFTNFLESGASIYGSIFSTAISLAANLYLSIPTMILGLGFFLMAQNIGGDITKWGYIAVISANILMSLPFAYAILAPAFEKVSSRYDKLSLSLGLGTWQQIKQIQWPYLRSSIGYISALSFALSLGDLGVISLFGNDEITTLPWYLYQLMGSYRSSDADGVAFVLLLLVIGSFYMVNLTQKKGINA